MNLMQLTSGRAVRITEVLVAVTTKMAVTKGRRSKQIFKQRESRILRPVIW
jgi:hypothetical protein